MFKKITAAILAIALIIAMWIVPAKATDFSNVPFFNVDFNSGSFDDIAGGVTGEEAYYGTVKQAEFVQDDTIGRKILRFHQESALFYTEFDYTKIQSNFTMEAYVKVPDRQSGWGYIAGSYWNTNPNAGVCFTYGTHVAADIGANMRFNVIEGNGTTSQTFTSNKGARVEGNWMHLVYVHDGASEYYYENGKLVASQAVWCQNIPSVTNDANKAFRIGGYNRASQFCANMDCAYVRVYDSPANDTAVATLYENRNNTAPVETEVPTESSTPVVTSTPTPTPDNDLPVLPEGPAYKVVVEDVPAFKKGDKVDITFKITDIEDVEGLMGVDLDIVYDYTLLKPVKNENGKAVVKSAKSEINSANPGANWDATSRLDGEDTETPTYVLKLFDDVNPNAEEPQKELLIKDDGVIWFTISFEALADSTPDMLLAYTIFADGADHNTQSVKGTGAYAFVKNGGEEPTPTDDKPTEVPTEQPTAQPTDKPTDGDNKRPGNTVTFDAGLVSLAAVALSPVVAAKKRRF